MIYRLGIDGGGTKTDALLVGANGEVAGRASGGGCNPSLIGPEGAKRVVAGVLRELLAPISARDPHYRIEAMLLCTAGARTFWQEFAASLTSFGRVVALDDSIPVLELATGGDPGLVLHAGTGSFVAAREQKVAPGALPGAVFYAGGLGWRFGDSGSGYDIARRAIARGLLELQGWLPESGMSKLIQEQTGLDDEQAIKRFFYNDSTSNPKIAEFAPAVLDLAAGGDAAIAEIVTHSLGQLMDLAIGVAHKLFKSLPMEELKVGLSGPILTHPFSVDRLTARGPFRLRSINEPPVEGVRRLLKLL